MNAADERDHAEELANRERPEPDDDDVLLILLRCQTPTALAVVCPQRARYVVWPESLTTERWAPCSTHLVATVDYATGFDVIASRGDHAGRAVVEFLGPDE